ncbi:hypothetical protein HHI36_013046 [Cryptolaemus montrouzieri]|uniref:Uncharacterized protein n=1 Tax=Cryptolaemus montrouzieri TaxID=559131 RepID=A0ABD2NFY3_9CUCU
MFSSQVKVIVCVAFIVAAIEAAQLITNNSLEPVKVLQTNSNVKLTRKLMQDKLTRVGDKTIGQRVDGDALLSTIESQGEQIENVVLCYVDQVTYDCVNQISFVNATNQGKGDAIVTSIDISDNENTVNITVCSLPNIQYDLFIYIYGIECDNKN